MKNVSLKSNNTNSPKTPGGISKSLLTPCRRLGLSRNWKKSGPSPFISPFASSSTDVSVGKNETKRRKECLLDEKIELTDNISSAESQVVTDQIAVTPSRNDEEPRKKKSKLLLGSITKSQEQELKDEKCDSQTLEGLSTIDCNITAKTELVSTPKRTKSTKIKKRPSPLKSKDKEAKFMSKSEDNKGDGMNEESTYSIKEKSPNDLSKECIVVIQKKIFKNIINKDETTNCKHEKPSEAVDSDSDEIPLISLQKQNSIKTNVLTDEDDDFIENEPSNAKSNRAKDLKSPKNKLKTAKPVKTKPTKALVEHKPPSQSCFDDDDDDFDNKKTILIRKTYDKVAKPSKAKSTGSITQKDIDNLRHRIEAKKKLLLAQSLTPETEELRNLIKKWQKGCQDALMELLDLMRNQFPDKESIDYSVMLRTLKIPPSLVGYDSENDCFNSPDDASIILGQFKDL